MKRRYAALNHPTLKLALVGLVSLMLTACGGETSEQYPMWDGQTPICGEDGILEGDVKLHRIVLSQYRGLEDEHVVRVHYDDGSVIEADISEITFLSSCSIIRGNIILAGQPETLAVFDTIEEVDNIGEGSGDQMYRPLGPGFGVDDFPNLRRIEGGIYFEPFEIAGLNKLEYLGEPIRPSSDLITGLNALTVWNGDLSANSRWTGLQALERVNGDASIGTPYDCSAFASFPSLKVITGTLYYGNTLCNGLPALEEIGGSFEANSPNGVLFPSLKRIGKTLFVRGYDGNLDENGQIPSTLFELPMLEEVGGHVWIDGTLAETLVLPSLRRVEHWFFVVDNSRLEDSSVELFRDQLDHYGAFVNCRNKGSECLQYDFPPSLDFD